MHQNDPNSLSGTVDALTRKGFKEDLVAHGEKFICNSSKKEFLPDELQIVHAFRFDGDTDPDNEAIVFAMVANDGTKGTLVMSFSADQDQYAELIAKVPFARKY